MPKHIEQLPKGIRLHKSGKYIADFTLSGKRITKTFDTIAQAKEWRNKALLEALHSRDCTATKSRGYSLYDAYQQTLMLYWQGNGGEKSARINSADALRFFGGDCPVSKITGQRIADYVQALLGKGLSGATVNRKLAALSRCLRTAHEQGHLESVPKMPRRKEGEHRVRFLSNDEERYLLNACYALGYGDELHDLLTFLLYTGFRCGEAFRVEARDVDTEHWTVTTWITKSGHARTVPIVPQLQEVLHRRLELHPSGKLFPYSTPWLRSRWERVKHFLGLDDDPQFVPHCLRHTCATRLARAGIGMPVIKEWLGHSAIQTTMRYSHFAPSDLARAGELLAKLAG